MLWLLEGDVVVGGLRAGNLSADFTDLTTFGSLLAQQLLDQLALLGEFGAEVADFRSLLGLVLLRQVVVPEDDLVPRRPGAGTAGVRTRGLDVGVGTLILHLVDLETGEGQVVDGGLEAFELVDGRQLVTLGELVADHDLELLVRVVEDLDVHFLFPLETSEGGDEEHEVAIGSHLYSLFVGFVLSV